MCVLGNGYDIDSSVSVINDLVICPQADSNQAGAYCEAGEESDIRRRGKKAGKTLRVIL